MADNDWRTVLPEGLRVDDIPLRQHPTLKDIPDVATLAKAYVDTKAFAGASIRIPGPDAGPDVRKEFLGKLREKVPELVLFPEDEKARAEVEADIWGKLGRPKEPKEYSLEGVKLDEGVKLNEEELRGVATKLGLTKKQFAALAGEIIGQGEAAKVRAFREAQKALKTEWGDAYEERVLQAKAVALKMGVPEASLAALSPEHVRVWSAVAKAVGGEAGEVARQTGGAGSGKLTPREAELQAAEIRSRPEYWEAAGNPDLHNQLVAKVAELMAIAYPG